MKKIFVASALANASLTVSHIVAVPAAAQAKAVAVADGRIAAARSYVFTTASQQIQNTSKAQIDQAETRGKNLQAEQHGREQCRDRVRTYVEHPVVAVYIKK